MRSAQKGRNPAASPGMLPEQHRDRFLTAAETQALVRALDAEPNQDAASALALLILTGARKQEVLRARWELVDLHSRRPDALDPQLTLRAPAFNPDQNRSYSRKPTRFSSSGGSVAGSASIAGRASPSRVAM